VNYETGKTLCSLLHGKNWFHFVFTGLQDDTTRLGILLYSKQKWPEEKQTKG